MELILKRDPLMLKGINVENKVKLAAGETIDVRFVSERNENERVISYGVSSSWPVQHTFKAVAREHTNTLGKEWGEECKQHCCLYCEDKNDNPAKDYLCSCFDCEKVTLCEVNGREVR